MTMTDRAFTLERTFAASPEAVYSAWTKPTQLDWFFSGAPGVTEPTTVDLREGGQWRQHMVIPGGDTYVTGGVYVELVPFKTIVFVWGAVGGWPDLDLARLDNAPRATIELRATGDSTLMTFTLELPAHWSDDEVRAALATGRRDGWSTTIDRLAGAIG